RSRRGSQPSTRGSALPNRAPACAGRSTRREDRARTDAGHAPLAPSGQGRSRCPPSWSRSSLPAAVASSGELGYSPARNRLGTPSRTQRSDAAAALPLLRGLRPVRHNDLLGLGLADLDVARLAQLVDQRRVVNPAIWRPPLRRQLALDVVLAPAPDELRAALRVDDGVVADHLAARAVRAGTREFAHANQHRRPLPGRARNAEQSVVLLQRGLMSKTFMLLLVPLPGRGKRERGGDDQIHASNSVAEQAPVGVPPLSEAPSRLGAEEDLRHMRELDHHRCAEARG